MNRFKCVVRHRTGHHGLSYDLPTAHLRLEGRWYSKAIRSGISRMLAFGCLMMGARADPNPDISNATDLTTLPPEKLGELEVYSPSKRPEKLSESAAAITVLTSDWRYEAPFAKNL